MAYATSAVFWGDEQNDWANPALLGYRKGLHVEWQKVQLLPDLADDIYFETYRYSLGAWGVGFVISGEPYRLDYGVSDLVDNGTVIGTYNPYEKADIWAVGVNLVELGETIVRGVSSHRNPSG